MAPQIHNGGNEKGAPNSANFKHVSRPTKTKNYQANTEPIVLGQASSKAGTNSKKNWAISRNTQTKQKPVLGRAPKMTEDNRSNTKTILN